MLRTSLQTQGLTLLDRFIHSVALTAFCHQSEAGVFLQFHIFFTNNFWFQETLKQSSALLDDFTSFLHGNFANEGLIVCAQRGGGVHQIPNAHECKEK